MILILPASWPWPCCWQLKWIGSWLPQRGDSFAAKHLKINLGFLLVYCFIWAMLCMRKTSKSNQYYYFLSYVLTTKISCSQIYTKHEIDFIVQRFIFMKTDWSFGFFNLNFSLSSSSFLQNVCYFIKIIWIYFSTGYDFTKQVRHGHWTGH